MTEKPQVLAVIPARYASTRFPGKPLAEIQGKPMIEHVWRQVSKAQSIHEVIIATDDERIYKAAEQFGASVMMTRADHPSGTDRMWEVAQKHPQYDLVFNIQGDEPFLDPTTLDAAVEIAHKNPVADIITAVTPIKSKEEFLNPNCVKAVMDHNGRALYFSRAPVPHHRDNEQSFEGAWRHLGLYLYRRLALAKFTELSPSPLEITEKLEQLRAIEAGLILHAVTVAKAPVGIDTPEDLAAIMGV